MGLQGTVLGFKVWLLLSNMRIEVNKNVRLYPDNSSKHIPAGAAMTTRP